MDLVTKDSMRPFKKLNFAARHFYTRRIWQTLLILLFNLSELKVAFSKTFNKRNSKLNKHFPKLNFMTSSTTKLKLRLTLNKKLFKPKCQSEKNIIQNRTQNQRGKNCYS